MTAARVAAVVVALGGCDRLLQLDSITPIADASIVDGRSDGSSSGCSPSYGKYGMGGVGLLQVCLLAPPIPSLDLTSAIDTAGCSLTVMQDDPAHSPVCVLAAEQITVSGHVTVTGSLPLVLLATQQLRVDAGAVLDVASHRTGSPGAGAMTGPCTLTGISGNTGNGGSGGAGGSFGTAGGAGGGGQTGIAAGMPAPTVTLSLIRGGCPGGGGGKSSGASGGLGGAGGGAVYLIAGTALTISGTIDASGAGGGNGTTTLMVGVYGGGGGGGGAGGLVALDSPSVTIPIGAEIYANGGGGGGGASDSNSGNPGQDPTAALTAASGGAGITNGGGGGAGFAAMMPTGVGATSKSGGGGGGGAGSIAIFTTGVVTLPSTISPTPLVR